MKVLVLKSAIEDVDSRRTNRPRFIFLSLRCLSLRPDLRRHFGNCALLSLWSSVSTAFSTRYPISSVITEMANEQSIATTYTAMQSEINQIYSKIIELEMEVNVQPRDWCHRAAGPGQVVF